MPTRFPSASISCCLASNVYAAMQILLAHNCHSLLTLQGIIECYIQPCYSSINNSVDKQAVKEHL